MNNKKRALKNKNNLLLVSLIVFLIILLSITILRLSYQTITGEAQKSDKNGGLELSPGITQCNDGVDNDNDGLVDYGYDLSCVSESDNSEIGVSGQLEDGWTNFEPSVDTRVVYVSSSTGDDSYDGLTPSTAKRTLASGWSLMRDTYPDWLLLKKGDTWYSEAIAEVPFGYSGRSESERTIVASYGQGERPRLVNGFFRGDRINNIAFVDIKFDVYDPNTWAPNTMTLGNGANYLIEGCYFARGGINIQNKVTNVKIRNSMLVDSISFLDGGVKVGGMGAFLHDITGLLMENNVVDYNGWRDPDIPRSVFTHNIYSQYTNRDVTSRNNIFARGSGENEMQRSGGDMINNLYLRGPFGLSYSDDKNLDPSGLIKDNVVLDGDDLWPTNGGRGFGIELKYVNDVEVSGNIIAHNVRGSWGFGISFGGDASNINLHDNIVYDWVGKDDGGWATVGISAAAAFSGNNYFTNNQINLAKGWLIDSWAGNPITYSGNTYYRGGAVNDHFQRSSPMGDSEWPAFSGETNAQFKQLNYLDPNRDISTYMASLGMTPTLEAFLAEARKNTKDNWDVRFTSNAVNDYIREGFQVVEEKKDDKMLVPGSGFSGETPQPATLGAGPGSDAKAIARWDVVPFQTITNKLNVGVLAYHINDIKSVDFSLDSGPWISVTETSINPDTNVDEYFVTFDAKGLSDGLHEIRAIAYPNVGIPRVLSGDFASHSGSLFLNSNSKGTLREVFMWVAPEGNDGNPCTEALPCASPFRVAQRGADLNNNADGVTVYMKKSADGTPGRYAWPRTYWPAPYTYTRFLTISSAPGLDRSEVIFDRGVAPNSDGAYDQAGGFGTSKVHMKDLTFERTAANTDNSGNRGNPYGGAWLWLQNVHFDGKGSGLGRPHSGWDGIWATDGSSVDSYEWAFYGALLLRGVRITKISSQGWQDVGGIFYSTIDVIDPSLYPERGVHPDLEYWWGMSGDVNAIRKNLRVYDSSAQTIFIKNGVPISNVVWDNVLYDSANSDINAQNIDHFIIKDSTFSGGAWYSTAAGLDPSYTMTWKNVLIKNSIFNLWALSIGGENVNIFSNHYILSPPTWGAQTPGTDFTTGDPGFVDQGSNDFTPKSDSVLCRSNGITVGAILCQGKTPVVVCGNSKVESGELCDSTSQSCTIDGSSGTQTCKSNCKGYDSCQIIPKSKVDELKEKFDGSQTIKLDEVSDLRKVSNLELVKNGIGRILFSKEIDLKKYDSSLTVENIAKKISDYVNIYDKTVVIDSANLPELNEPASITLNIGVGKKESDLVIHQDGVKCPADVCSSPVYNSLTGELSFSVTHWTNYTIIESNSSDNSTENNSSNNGSISNQTGNDSAGSGSGGSSGGYIGGGGGGGGYSAPAVKNNTNASVNKSPSISPVDKIKELFSVPKVTNDNPSDIRVISKSEIIIISLLVIIGLVLIAIIIRLLMNRFRSQPVTVPSQL